MKLLRSVATSLCALLLPSQTTYAQSYPERPITIVVPYSAETGLNNVGRVLANELSKRLKQAVVVENRPGAGTNIGTAHVVRSKPDGYTLLIAANSALAANQSLYSNIGFDPQADLAPIAFLGKGSMVVLSTPASGVRNMDELLKFAKENPSKTNFGAANTTARVWIELLKSMAGLEGETVIYSNTGAMFGDLLGGRINFTVENTGTSRVMMSSGKLIPLAVTSKQRGKFNADVPTLTELGMGNYEVDTWYALLAPKGTPPEIIKRLNAEVDIIMKTDAYIKAISMTEYTDTGGSPEEIGAFQASEIEKWKMLVDKTGVRLK